MIWMTLYFFLTLLATTLGAITGMGGGVIIKPMLDALGQMDAATINVLSSLAVLFMSVVSMTRFMKTPKRFEAKTVLSLAAGSIAGGWIGGKAISRLIGDGGAISSLIQNIILAFMILAIMIYMYKKNSIKGFAFNGIVPSLLVGLGLGTLAAFLGIGGGPINVAIVIFFFSYSTKTAALVSIIIIFFSHLTKVSGILLAGNLQQYNFSMLVPILIGAVLGGFVGSLLQEKMPEKTVERIFFLMQCFVLLLCLFNIGRLCFNGF